MADSELEVLYLCCWTLILVSSFLSFEVDQNPVLVCVLISARLSLMPGLARSNAIEIPEIDDEEPCPSVLDRYSLADDDVPAPGPSSSQELAIDKLIQ